ncbi:zinc-dependent peptidase [Belliella kenyensis]|uniref:Zinc-dependent peptidase n=1 Tax=Belliella kenyensis TaxID=1472724 RepID=A0ABV8EIN8_9BACT|nr:zinc-dependent peptidase [Belliella kenyensis]MCH7403469.1 zinc-dependent peptidase [Belliella kenyensis]MDN3602369.1 zinc-dependent peptidase [Belliella kenyensis]
MFFLTRLFFSLGEHVYASYRNLKLRWIKQKLSPQDKKVLTNLFSYFAGLSSVHKEEFAEKVEWFIAEKEFLPRGDLKVVTQEMKLLIAATAVMVTFGYPRVRLKHFSKILIYPDSYYSTINKQYHQGEVNPRLGIIVLSWENFVKGFIDQENGVNLGIHEIAHAMKLENQIHYNRESRFFNPDLWERYAEQAKLEMGKIRNNQKSLFRESAGINAHEFFAVALETFFEKSSTFKAYNKELYQSLVYLLRQDPLVIASRG